MQFERAIIANVNKSILHFQPGFGEISLDRDWGLLSLVEKEIPQTDTDELTAIKTVIARERDIKNKLELKAKTLPDGRRSYHFDSTYSSTKFIIIFHSRKRIETAVFLDYPRQLHTGSRIQ